MSKETTLNRLHDLGIVAVIRGPSPELTVRMVEALVAALFVALSLRWPLQPAFFHLLAPAVLGLNWFVSRREQPWGGIA